MTDTAEQVSDDAPGGHDRSPHDELFDADSELVSYERSPLDVLRALLFVAAALIVVLLTKFFRDGFDGIEENLTALLDVPWSGVKVGIDVLLIVAVLVATLVVLVVPLATRRFRLFGYVLAANVTASLLSGGIGTFVNGLDAVGATTTASANDVALSVSTDVANMTQMVAAFVVISPFVTRRWRRAGAWLVGTVLVLRLVVTNSASTHALLILTVGAAVGSLILLAFGRPTTQPRMTAILEALRASGIPVASIEPASVDARGSVPYFATLDDGGRVFAKVLGTDQRAADLLFRVYRTIRLKNVGDERPFSSLRRTVEHEALVSLQARDVGVRTPRLRCVAPVGRDSFLLSYDLIAGTSLDGVDADRLTPDVLLGLWQEVALLRRFRIAHRDLRLANVFLDDDEQPWLIDFGFSEIAASDTLLRADIAQLIAALAVVVGPERAVTPAVRALGPEAVADSLGRLQPAALSGATQTDLKHHHGLLADVRAEIERQCDTTEPEMEPVTRFGGRQIFTLVMLGAVFYFLLPQLADLPGIIQQIREADWIWMIPILLASAGTYLAATMSITGSVPGRIPLGPTAAAQVGSSFASKVAPAGLGGMALNLRFLQRQGVDTAVATSGIGLNAGAGVVGHVVLVGVFIFWAGNDAFGDISLPSPWAFLIGAAVVAVLAALAMAFPTSRTLVLSKLVPILGKAVSGLRDVLTTPSKVILLFGGSTLVTLSYVVAFYFAGRAFGLDESFATIGAVYLVGSAIATAAPTPGGLGAAEAALIGGLIAIGVNKDLAVPTVFLFRLATFWIPILPGWIAFTWLRRTDRL
jgi:glycosyltransferase 2 family protein